MENNSNYERELAYTDNREDNIIYRTNISFNHFGVGSGISYDNGESEDLEWF